ncbi:MAG: internal scaffolding protein [Microvirus sp.]|nr:MAG: internal scaffolding protein [Microvirus sp.]
MKFSNQYEHHDGPELHDFGPSLTRQEFLEESDINHIINQYETDGINRLTQNGAEPIFGDFSDPALNDYHHAQNLIQGAQNLFEALPARTRERFNNDPASIIAFTQDPANTKEAYDLGLLREDYKPPEPKVEPTTANPATPSTVTK